MSEFDAYSESYADVVNQSVSFAGADVDYYAKRKAEHLVEVISRQLGDPGSVEALDVGCGVGITDGFVAPHLGRVHGVDVAQEAVEQAAQANPSVAYHDYDGTHLPFEDAAVDVAFAICVAHHVPVTDRNAFVHELARVVRPGGLVIVFEHNPLNPLTRLAVSRCEFDEGVVLLSRKTVGRLLGDAGLDVVESRYIIFTPYDRPALRAVERALHPLPLGAQHCVAARR